MFMHVHDCIVSAFQSAWFDIFFAASLECAKHGKLFGAQKPSVCGSGTILNVFREMCDNRAVRMCDSGAKPRLARFAYS